MFSLKNKNIVITGSLGLLGTEFTDSIAEYQGNLILIDLDQDKLDKQAKNIEKSMMSNVEDIHWTSV